MSQTGMIQQWTILSLIQWSEKYLAAQQIEHPRLNAERMLASVLDCDRVHLYTRFDQPLGKDELARYKALLIRRVNREPLHYILGYADFYRKRFAVQPGVLIPRPETEQLVDAALELLKTRPDTPLQILDVGTGSGCIAVTIATELPHAVVTAIDISDDALSVARENARIYDVADRIRFHRFDIREGYAELPGAGYYSVIITNPPYIPYNEWQRLPDEIKVHEPEDALTDGGDGLLYYRVLSACAPDALTKNGWMICEVGYDQYERVHELFVSNGVRESRYWYDLNGIKRIIGGTW